MFELGALAWGAVGGAIPVIIHLLNRRRFRITRWAAMEFLLASLRKNYKRVRMENLLLLLLRVLMVVLIAFALARPRLTESGIIGALGTEDRHAVLIIDDSYSMGFRTGSETSFSRAQAAAQQILLSFNRGDAISLLAMSDVTRPIIKEGTLDFELVKREAARMEPGWGGTDVSKALIAAAELLDSTKKPRKEIFLLTDMQACGWGKTGEPVSAELNAALERIGKTAKVFVVDVGPPEGAENLAITALTPQSRIVGTGASAEFRVDVTNFGRSTTSEVQVRLLVDKFNQNVETLKVAPGKTEAATFRHSFQTKGSHVVEVELSDDRLAADNRRYLAVNAEESVPVLLVNGETSPEVEENETYYLERALRPPAKEGEVRASHVEPSTVTEFGLSGVDFARYRLVVLANLASLAAHNTVVRLEEYVRQGGALVIFLGDRVDRSFYNEQLFRGGEGLLPAGLGPEQGSLGADRKGVTIELVKPVHPAFERLTVPLVFHLTHSVLFHKYFDLKLPAKTEDIRVAARFEGGNPAVVEKAFGRGRVVLFASSADAEWNNFPKFGTYVVVMQDLLGYLASGGADRRNLVVHQPYRRTFAPEELVESVTVRSPGRAGAEKKLRPYLVAPEKGVRPEDGGAAFTAIEFADTDVAGPYELELQRKDVAESRADCFVVNVPPEEGDLTRCSPDDITARFKNVDFKYVKNVADLQLAVQQSRSGREFTRSLLLAVLAIACVELILAQRFGR